MYSFLAMPEILSTRRGLMECRRWPHSTNRLYVLHMYDARLVGARDLLYNAFDASITLDPLRPHAELESGGRHVRQTAYMTAFSAALTVPVLVLAWEPLPRHEILYRAISMALATTVKH
jgi:hypothetical protein